MQFVDFTDEVTPCLVMEYLPLGNLQEQHERVARITEQEVVSMLSQLLHALEHLHSRGVVHRDVKPQNILVQSQGCLQEPSQFWVKLGDFGLAKDSHLLATFCGTQLYLAPEVRTRSRYTSAVDIWSLGIIIFQYAYGLPRQDLPFIRENWYQKLIRSAEDWDSEDLVDFLSSGMLVMDPRKRLSARACLQRASKLRVTTPLAWNLEDNLRTPTRAVTPILGDVVPNLGRSGRARASIKSRTMLFGEFAQSPTQTQKPPASRTGEVSEESVLSEADTIRENCTRTSKHSIKDHIQAPAEIRNRKLPRQAGAQVGVGNIRPYDGFLHVLAGTNPVMIRKSDFSVNATQILKAAGKPRRDLQKIRKGGIIPFNVIPGHHTIQGTYVEFTYGLKLCQEHGLYELRRLLQETYEEVNHRAVASKQAPILISEHESRSLDPRNRPSQLDEPLCDPVEAEDSYVGLMEEAQEQEDITGSEAGDLSEEFESPNSQYSRSQTSRNQRARRTDRVGSLCASVDCSKQRSAFTEVEDSEIGQVPIQRKAGVREVELESNMSNSDLSEQSQQPLIDRHKQLGREETEDEPSCLLSNFMPETGSKLAADQTQHSMYTEPSYSHGSFLPPMKDSFPDQLRSETPVQPHRIQSLHS